LILLNKKPGITSFDALRDIKRLLGTGKVGHTGTLDKFAEGLLLILAGRALKLSRWFTNCDKQYEGTICFGTETDTLDPEGAVIANAPLPSREEVENVFSQFTGEIEQAPPAYSAIRIGGKRASALARGGDIPEMKKRPVSIYRLELLSWDPPYAKIFVHCSSGTYIRSLARDLAIAAGSRGYLAGLLRTKVGEFRIEEAVGSIGIGDRGQGTGDRGIRREPSPCGLGLRTQIDRTANQYAQIANNDPLSLVPCPLSPINKSVFYKLKIPCIDISSDDAVKVAQGKPLAQMLFYNELTQRRTGAEKKEKIKEAFITHHSSAPLRLCVMKFDTTALFSNDELIAMIENVNGWKYGLVYASN